MTEQVNWDSMEQAAKEINEWARRTFPRRQPKAALSKLTMEEIPELLIHLKEHGRMGIGEELADCFILLLDLAVIWNVDLAKAIQSKMDTNQRRMWIKDEDLGHWNHVDINNWTCRVCKFSNAMARIYCENCGGTKE